MQNTPNPTTSRPSSPTTSPLEWEIIVRESEPQQESPLPPRGGGAINRQTTTTQTIPRQITAAQLLEAEEPFPAEILTENFGQALSEIEEIVREDRQYARDYKNHKDLLIAIRAYFQQNRGSFDTRRDLIKNLLVRNEELYSDIITFLNNTSAGELSAMINTIVNNQELTIQNLPKKIAITRLQLNLLITTQAAPNLIKNKLQEVLNNLNTSDEKRAFISRQIHYLRNSNRYFYKEIINWLNQQLPPADELLHTAPPLQQ